MMFVCKYWTHSVTTCRCVSASMRQSRFMATYKSGELVLWIALLSRADHGTLLLPCRPSAGCSRVWSSTGDTSPASLSARMPAAQRCLLRRRRCPSRRRCSCRSSPLAVRRPAPASRCRRRPAPGSCRTWRGPPRTQQRSLAASSCPRRRRRRTSTASAPLDPPPPSPATQTCWRRPVATSRSSCSHRGYLMAAKAWMGRQPCTRARRRRAAVVASAGKPLTPDRRSCMFM